MSERRFYINDYGIWDALKDNKKLTWADIRDTLNEFDMNMDTEVQELLVKISALEDENKELKELLGKIHDISGSV